MGIFIWAMRLLTAPLVWPIAAPLSVLLERGYTRSDETGEAFPHGMGVPVHSGLLCCRCLAWLFPARLPTMCRISCVRWSGVFDASSAAAHRWLLGGLCSWPRAGNMDIGAAIYTAVQMGLLAGCFALTSAARLRVSAARARQTRAAVFFRALSGAYGDGGERDERRAVRRFFCADARFLNEMNGEADPRPVCENRACGALAVMLAQQHGVCRAGVAGAVSVGSRRGAEMRRWPCCWRWRWALAEMRRSKARHARGSAT